MKKKIFNTDKIIALSAIFISLLTLIIFLYQTRVISKQARLSVTPRISFIGGISNQKSSVTFSVGIKNNGLGPAIIDSTAILSNKKYYPLNFKEFTKNHYPTADSITIKSSSTVFNKGATVLPNNEVILSEVEVSRDKLKDFYALYNLEIEENRFPFDIIIYYSSIYEEKWKVTLYSEGHPREL